MSQCPITYEVCSPEKYSTTGLNKLSRGLKRLDPFEDALLCEQPGGDLQLNWSLPWGFGQVRSGREHMEATQKQGKFILIPPAKQFLQSSENIDLSMRLAAWCTLEVPTHGMIYNRDETLTYFVEAPAKRVPLIAAGSAIPGLGKPREPETVEGIVALLDHACTFPVVEKYHFFRRLLFSWLIGYQTQSWKDYYLLRQPHKTTLAPPLLFANTQLFYGRQERELGLSMQGIWAGFEAEHFTGYLGREVLGLSPEAVQYVLSVFKKVYGPWRNLVRQSFLSEELKEQYLDVIVGRLSRLRI